LFRAANPLHPCRNLIAMPLHRPKRGTHILASCILRTHHGAACEVTASCCAIPIPDMGTAPSAMQFCTVSDAHYCMQALRVAIVTELAQLATWQREACAPGSLSPCTAYITNAWRPLTIQADLQALRVAIVPELLSSW
jgi:hypothetical protein